MENIVNHILNKKEKDDISATKKYLETQLQTIKQLNHQINQAVEMLDPFKHSLGICYLLFCKAFNPDPQFYQNCGRFFLGFNPQHILDYCADKFGVIVHKYTEQTRYDSHGILLIQRVISLLSPGPEYLTPAHPDYVMLCLCQKNYKAATRILEQTIYEVNPTKTGVSPKDFMLYYYYGGMVWCGLKKWNKAHEFFYNCITIPSTALSSIVVEAFKKYILVSLILKGKMENVPKQCSNIIQRHIKKYASEYMELATSYTKRETPQLLEFITKFKPVFTQDKNYGLVLQCKSQYMRQSIQRLTSTYITLSLSDIAANVGLSDASEVETLLVSMIQDGELAAKISQKDGMVSFMDNVNPATLINSIEEHIVSAQKLIQRLEKMDDDIVISKDYISKQVLRDPHLREQVESEARNLGGAKDKLQKVMNFLKS